MNAPAAHTPPIDPEETLQMTTYDDMVTAIAKRYGLTPDERARVTGARLGEIAESVRTIRMERTAPEPEPTAKERAVAALRRRPRNESPSVQIETEHGESLGEIRSGGVPIESAREHARQAFADRSWRNSETASLGRRLRVSSDDPTPKDAA